MRARSQGYSHESLGRLFTNMNRVNVYNDYITRTNMRSEDTHESEMVVTVLERCRPQVSTNEHVAVCKVKAPGEVGVEAGNLGRGQRAPGWVACDVGELGRFRRGERARGRWQWVVLKMVTHQDVVLQHVPVDAIVDEVIDDGVVRASLHLESARPVAHHPEHEQFSRAGAGLAAKVQPMRIPRLAPLLRVLVDAGEKEMMDQPDVLRALGFQTVTLFEFKEEDLPFPAEALRDVVP